MHERFEAALGGIGQPVAVCELCTRPNAPHLPQIRLHAIGASDARAAAIRRQLGHGAASRRLLRLPHPRRQHLYVRSSTHLWMMRRSSRRLRGTGPDLPE